MFYIVDIILNNGIIPYFLFVLKVSIHKIPTGNSIDQVQSYILLQVTEKKQNLKMTSLVTCVTFWIPAHAADEALGMVCAAKSRDHLSCDKAVTAITARAI